MSDETRADAPYVVFDIDGVLADLTHGLTKLAHERWGTPVIRGEDQPTWSFRNALSKEQQDEIWRTIFAMRGFWGGLAPFVTPADLREMHRLERFGYRILYLTNRSGRGARRETQAWLWRNRFPYGELEFTRDKAASLAGRDVLAVVEDSPANIEAMAGAGLDVCVMDRPYNASVSAGVRVKSVVAFAAHIYGRLHPDEAISAARNAGRELPVWAFP